MVNIRRRMLQVVGLLWCLTSSGCATWWEAKDRIGAWGNRGGGECSIALPADYQALKVRSIEQDRSGLNDAESSPGGQTLSPDERRAPDGTFRYLVTVPDRREDADVAIHAVVEDSQFRFGRNGPLLLESQGTFEYRTEVMVSYIVLDAIFTAGLGLIVDFATGYIYDRPSDWTPPRVTLRPDHDADRKRIDYTTAELAYIDELIARNELEGANARASTVLAAIGTIGSLSAQAEQARQRQSALAPRLETQRRETQRIVGLVQNKRLLINRSGEENAFAVVDFGSGGRINVLASGVNVSRWQIISQSQRIDRGRFVFAVQGVLPADSSYVIEIDGLVDVDASRFNGNVTIYRGGAMPEQIRAGGRLIPLIDEGR